MRVTKTFGLPMRFPLLLCLLSSDNTGVPQCFAPGEQCERARFCFQCTLQCGFSRLVSRVHAVFQNSRDTVLAERGRLKPRLNGLRPRNPPSRVAERCPPDAPLAHALQPAEAGFVDALSASLRRGFSRQPPWLLSLAVWKRTSRAVAPPQQDIRHPACFLPWPCEVHCPHRRRAGAD